MKRIVVRDLSVRMAGLRCEEAPAPGFATPERGDVPDRQASVEPILLTIPSVPRLHLKHPTDAPPLLVIVIRQSCNVPYGKRSNGIASIAQQASILGKNSGVKHALDASAQRQG